MKVGILVGVVVALTVGHLVGGLWGLALVEYCILSFLLGWVVGGRPRKVLRP